MVSLQDVKKGLFRYEEADKGWVVPIKSASSLLKAAEKVRDSGKVKNFDCFTPFPIHGLEDAMGLGRSWLSFVTLIFGLIGMFVAVGFMTYVDVIDWPMNIGGKPFFAWPAYIPITFEVSVLFAGLASAGAVIFLGRLGKNRRLPVEAVTSDSYALWIGDPLDEAEIKDILGEYAEGLKKIS